MTNQSRCSRHQDATTLPQLCPICQRIDVERRIVEKVVDTLLSRGWRLNLMNGGEGYELPEWTSDRATILAVMMETNDEYLHARKVGHRLQYVFFVYGNSGYDVVSDYTIGLDIEMEIVNNFADTFEPK